MAHALAELLDADALRNRLGENAARIARAEYDAEQQCDTYLQWYRTLTHSGVAVQGVEAE
jgi:glycosyltransferase involved in cell wall biosynthesis